MATDASATYEINLEDGLSGPAESAVDALNKLQRQMQSDTRELAQLQKAMKNLQGGSSVNIQQFKELQTRITAKKQTIADAQSAYLKLGGSMKGATGGAKSTTSAFAQFEGAASKLPGPLGGMASKLGNIRGLLAGGAMAVGIAAIAAALVALAAAAIGAVAALASYGIAQANARRSELLRLEGLTKMRNWWGVAAGNASEMQANIDQVSGSVALGRDKIAQYASELHKMGVRGENAKLALEAAAIKGAVLGDEGAKSAMHWAAGIALAGGNVKRVTDDIKARFGGIAAAQMLDLDVQTQKLRENLGALFSGLKIEAFLKSISEVTALFSQSTLTGRALKSLLEKLFQPLVGVMESVAPGIKRFFQGMLAGALMAGIAVLRLRLWWRETFGDSEILKGMDWQKAAFYAGITALGLLGAAFVAFGALATGALVAATPFIWGALTATVAFATGGLAAMWGAMIGLIPVVWGAVTAFASLAIGVIAATWPFLLAAVAIGALIAAGYQLYQLWKEIDWTSLGNAIIDGIVDGIKKGVTWVIDAITDLGQGAWKAFTETLGIASPSKVFAKLGLAIPEGITGGVEAGTPDARQAVADVVEVPDAPEPRSRSTGAASSKSSARTSNVTISELHIHTSSDKPADVAQAFKAELVRVLAGVSAQLGVPEGT